MLVMNRKGINVKKEFKDILLELLRATGTSNYRLAKETGASKTSIAKWLDGSNQPYLPSAIKIAEFFNCSLDELAGLVPMDEERIKEISRYRYQIKPDAKRVEYVPVCLSEQDQKEFDELMKQARWQQCEEN